MTTTASSQTEDTGDWMAKVWDAYVYEGVVYNQSFERKETIEEMQKFEVNPDDVILSGYPKSGCTWVQEIVWLLRNNLNFEESTKRCVWERVPSLERAPVNGAGLYETVNMPKPRFYRTHVPFWLLKEQIDIKKPKVVSIMRNPKDLQVSYYHFINTCRASCVPTFQNWMDCVKTRRVIFGDWFDHMLGWWSNKDKDNFLFLKYEDMLEDPFREIKKISDFLETGRPDEDIQKIVESTTFEAMKKNPGTNLSKVKWLDNGVSKYHRKGIAGDWKNWFTDENNEYIEKRYKNEVESVGLKFRFE